MNSLEKLNKFKYDFNTTIVRQSNINNKLDMDILYYDSLDHIYTYFYDVRYICIDYLNRKAKIIINNTWPSNLNNIL